MQNLRVVRAKRLVQLIYLGIGFLKIDVEKLGPNKLGSNSYILCRLHASLMRLMSFQWRSIWSRRRLLLWSSS